MSAGAPTWAVLLWGLAPAVVALLVIAALVAELFYDHAAAAIALASAAGVAAILRFVVWR